MFKKKHHFFRRNDFSQILNINNFHIFMADFAGNINLYVILHSSGVDFFVKKLVNTWVE